jgi:hypothetical protein
VPSPADAVRTDRAAPPGQVQRHGLPTFKFVKVRSRGRKVYSYRRDDVAAIPAQPFISAAPRPADVGKTTPQGRPLKKFEFMPNDRYCLTRLSPEEAAARRKRIEEKKR